MISFTLTHKPFISLCCHSCSSKLKQMLGFPTSQGCLRCITPANACTLSSCLCSCSSRPPPMPKTRPTSEPHFIMLPTTMHLLLLWWSSSFALFIFINVSSWQPEAHQAFGIVINWNIMWFKEGTCRSKYLFLSFSRHTFHFMWFFAAKLTNTFVGRWTHS